MACQDIVPTMPDRFFGIQLLLFVKGQSKVAAGGVEDALLQFVGDAVTDDLKKAGRHAGGANIFENLADGGGCRVSEVRANIDGGNLKGWLLLRSGRHGYVLFFANLMVMACFES